MSCVFACISVLVCLLAGIVVDVDAAVSRGRGGTGHHGDGAGHRAEELRAAVLQDVADGEPPAGGNALLGRVVGQGQVGLDHHGAVILVLRVRLEALSLLRGQRRPVAAVSAVDFLGDQLTALTQRHVEVVQDLDVDRLLAGFVNGLGQLDGAFAAVTPVVGLRAAHAVLLAELLQQGDLSGGGGVEAVDADNRDDAGLLDGVHMVEQVLAALLQQLQVLLGVLLGQGPAGHHGGAAAVHLQGADGSHQHGHVGSQAAEAGLDVPELLKADVGSEAGLGDVIVEQLQKYIRNFFEKIEKI